MKPIITSFTPSGSPGDIVNISGKFLSGATRVTIGGKAAPILFPGGKGAHTDIIVQVPDGAVSGPVEITTPDGTFRTSQMFTVKPPQRPPSGIDNFLTSNPIVGELAQRFLPYSGGAAIVASGANISGSARAASQAVDNVLGGVGSAASRAFDVGVSIGEKLLGGVLSPFGASGRAITGFAGTAARGAGSLIGMGASAVGGVLSAGAGVAGGALSIGLGAGGAAIGALAGASVGSAPGGLVGFAVGTGIGLAVLKGIESVSGMVGGVVGKIGEAFGKLGDVAGSALGTVIDVLQDVTRTAQETAGSVLKINQLGGFGMGQSAGLVSTLGFFGMSPQQVAGRFSTPFAPITLAAGSGMLGLPNIADNPGAFLMAGARRFEDAQRQGPMGVGVLRAMMNGGMGGGADEAFMPLFGLGEKRIGKVLDFQNRMAMSPEAVDSFGKDIQVLQGMISGFANFLKITLGTALIPVIESGLESAVDFITKNQDKIIDAIFNFGDFVYSKLPVMIGEGLLAILTFTKGFTDGLIGLVDSFQQGNGGFLEIIGNMLEGVDWLTAGWDGLTRVLGTVGIAVWNAIVFIERAAAQLLGLVGMKVPQWDYIDPLLAFKVESSATDFRGAFENFRQSNTTKSVGSGLQNASNTQGEWIKSLDSYVSSLRDGQQGRSDTVQHLKRIATATEKTAEHAEETAKHTRDGMGLKEFFRSFFPNFSAMLIERQYRDLSRP